METSTKAHNLKTKVDILELIKARNIKRIKLATTDIDGILRGKYVSVEKFISVLENGIGFCDVIFGWDMHDEIYPQDSITGWHTSFPDAWGQIDISSVRELPLEENSLLFLVDFSDNSKHNEVCPRSILKKVLNEAKEFGINFSASCEFEFFVFNEAINSIREKNYQDLQPLTPGMFGYSVIRNSTHSSLYHKLMDMCLEMDMPIEGLHTETGPGVLEAALNYDEALRAADKGVLFKTFTKVLMQQENLLATFMAKWSQKYPGQSGHLHISAKKENGKSLFFDATKENNMSQEMLYFIGGQQKLMPEILAIIAPTCNSYTRLIPGFWAPTQATWSIDNRTCALRAILGGEKSQRVEYRVSAADINPYLALATAIGTGLWGIKNKIVPTNPIVGNAYEKNLDKKYHLPLSLDRACDKLENSTAAKKILNETFINHYLVTRRNEVELQRKAITNWQLERYFEII